MTRPTPDQLIKAGMILVLVSFFLPWVQVLPARKMTVQKKTRPESWRPKDTPRDSKPLLNPEMQKYLKEFKTGVKSVELTVRSSGRLSGFQIPRAANSQVARTAIQFAGLFQSDKPKKQELKSVGLKSYAVYLLPGIHLLLGLLLLRFGRLRWLAAAVALLGLAVPPAGCWQMTKALSQSSGAASAEYGLWLSLLSYWVLAAGAGAMLLRRQA